MLYRLLCCVLLCGFAGGLSAETRRAPFVNPQISARDIALNQSVRVAFVTVRAQVPGIDIESTVQTAIDVPSSSKYWRIIDEPTVKVHDKTGSVNVSYVLMPREPGTLPLPEMPLRWLDEGQIAQFGDVVVREELKAGRESLPLPDILTSVNRYLWTTTEESIAKSVGSAGEAGTLTGERIFTVDDGLVLHTVNGQLAKATVTVPNLTLERARINFINRWGEPILDATDSESPMLQWVLGWIRITATQIGTNMRLQIVREDQERQSIEAHLEEHLFKLLSGQDSSDEDSQGE